jgi:trans-2,3-dihydro-3-hydroxyanthranilate isomerase
MKELDFIIVDVFAEKKYAGNQLAVFTQAQDLSDQQMQQIAQETHFSETTFIRSDRQADGGYAVRIFTPGAEVPFAGHPTLGTAWVIRHILGNPHDTVSLNLGVGQIPVDFQDQLLWMTTRPPIFGETLPAEVIAPILRLDTTDLDECFPNEVVSTGLPFIFVPLKTLDAVKRVRLDTDRLTQLVTGKDITNTIFVFCPETYSADNQINARLFAPAYGIPEDPATGSANSCLAAYLVKHRYFDTSTINIKVEQGYEIGRPSRLYLKASEKPNSDILIKVGGKVQLIAKGQFL